MNQEIIKRFKSFGHPQSIKKFFDLLNELITQVNISADNPRLALNVRNDYQKRISVSINSRLVLSLRENTPVPLLGFMLPEGVTEKEVPNHIDLLKGDPFVNSTENFYEFKYDNLHAFSETLKQKWIDDCREYLPSQKSSQYRKHHIPELYKLAQAPDLLQEYFYEVEQLARDDEFKLLLPGQLSYLRYMWNTYRESVDKDYIKEREERLDFVPTARKLIKDLLDEHSTWNHDHLNALNQLLKLDPSPEVVTKYLGLVFEGQKLIYYTQAFENAEKKGITTLGLNGFDETKISLDGIENVRFFLAEAFNSELDPNDTLQVIKTFEKLKVSYVKKGVFSPWLFIINTELFPISNGTHEGLLKYLGYKTTYRHSFLLQHEILRALGTDDFGHLDSMILWYGEDFPRLFRIGTSIGESGATVWPEMLEQGVASIGWSNIGDLSKNDEVDKKLLIQQMKDAGYDKAASRLSREAGEILSFYKDVNEGDFVLACKGQTIKGIGRVVGKYKYRNGLSFAHTKDVKWLYVNENNKAPILKEGIRTTVWSLTPESDHIFSFVFNQVVKENSTAFTGIMIPEKTMSLSSPTNTILYGPPGTGKTYSTKAYALSLLRDGTADHLEQFAQLREHDKANFNRKWLHHKQSDQVEFVTFHQSFSYEDFVQGIRPDVEADGVKFQRVDGIFKTICTNALFEYYKLKWVEESNSNRKWSFDELWVDFTGWVLKTTDAPYPLEAKSGGTIYLDGFSDSGNFRLRHENRSRKYTVSMFRMNKLFNAFSSIDDIANVHDDIRSVIGGANTSCYWAVFNALKKHEAENTPWEVLRPDDLDSYEYDDRKMLVQNPERLRKYTGQKVPQYVLIVDEINRANISRVLGELITLLEPDKRLGHHDELIIKLPSGEPFAVPPNLHIIGTMNTADKSIAHLDVALRRRFQFISMYPDLAKVTNDRKRHLLELLNKFIIEMSSPELSIGHSYFMTEDSIESIMNNKVIPLLNEYFDYRTDEMREILEKAGLAVSKDAYGQLTCLGYNELESEKGAH